ncbi:hypothetical protein [Sutcliffiella horikoshii]|uniref:hypothetical protein n=1 Tax=Sutcliffiella horikoshii TaxID=79883 RepID=UPI003CEFF15C
MVNTVIYYQKNKNESTEQAVSCVNKLIKQLEPLHIIKGVFLDSYVQSTELMELLNSPLDLIDYIYFNRPVENEFDKELITQLKRAEQFEIIYYDNI